MQTILLAVDFSPASRNAAVFAAELAKLLHTKLLLFHAYMLPTPISEVPYAMVTVDNLQRENEEQIKKEADWVHDNYGLEVEWLVREVGSGTREVVENALAKWDLPPAGALEFGGAETLKQAVAAVLGVAFVSREAAKDQLALGKLVTLIIPGFTLRRPFYRLELKGRPKSPAARAFEEFLTQC